jgi:hypothetical protein
MASGAGPRAHVELYHVNSVRLDYIGLVC